MLKRLGIFLFLLSLTNVTYIHYWLFFQVVTLAPYCPYFAIQLADLSYSHYFSRVCVCPVSIQYARTSLRKLLLLSLFVCYSGHASLECLFRNLSLKHCLIIPYSIGGGLSIAGFLLYLVVAGRYKRRVRDEEYNPQTHIEAIYDRYLSQAQASLPY